jgi:hypothetical protein
LANLLAVLLIVEAFGTAHAVTQILPNVGVYRWWTLLLIGARILVAGVQFVAAMKLWRDDAFGLPIARAAVLASAILLTFEIGWRLSPTNSDPTFRWWFVGGYWAYAALVVAFLARPKRAMKRMKEE